jgi:hypothetical protein
MSSVFDRLYQTKLQLIAVIMTFAGAVLLTLAHVTAGDAGPAWLHQLPLTDFGSALFTTGLLAVAFEYIDRRDGDERANQRLRQVLREEAPAMRDAVLDSLAFNADALKDVASPELLDRIAVNALGLRLNDQALATDAYTDLRNQVIRAPERWREVHASVALTPWDKGPSTGRGAMFVATVRWQYRVTPSSPIMRVACVSDLDEYRDLLRDPSMTAVWYFAPVDDLRADSPGVFELVQVTVNGHERSVRHAGRKGSQVSTVSLRKEHQAGEEITLSFTYRVLVQQAGHLLHLDVPRPAHGLQVQFNYAGTGIRYVNALDFIASADQPRVLRTPKSVPTPSIDIGFDGWVFPRSGVAFVWVLNSELTHT